MVYTLHISHVFKVWPLYIGPLLERPLRDLLSFPSQYTYSAEDSLMVVSDSRCRLAVNKETLMVVH